MPSRSSSSHTATAAFEGQTLFNEPNNPPDTSEHQSEDEEENRERSVSVHQSSVHDDESPPSSIEPSIDGFEKPPRSHRRRHPQSRYHDGNERASRRHWTEQRSEYHDHVHDRGHVRDRERGRGDRHRERRSSTKDDEHHSGHTRSSKKPTILYDNGRTKLTTEKFIRTTSLPPGCDKVEIVTIHTNHKGGRETRFKRYKYEGQSWIPGRTRDPRTRSEFPERHSDPRRGRARKTRRTNDGYTDEDWGNETNDRTEEHRRSRRRSRSRSRSTTPEPVHWESRRHGTVHRERSPSVGGGDRSRERSRHGRHDHGHSRHLRDDPPNTQAESRSKHRSSKSRPDRETSRHGQRGQDHSRHHRDGLPNTQPSSRLKHRSSKSRPSRQPSGSGRSHTHRTRQRRTTYTVVPQGSSACVIL